MIRTFFRAYFKKLPQKNIEYWISKNLYKDDFLNELDFEFSRGTIYKYKGNQYDILTNIPRMVLDKHALIKIKKISLNHAPLMSKESSKIIMNRYKLRNKYAKWSSRENF